MYVKDEAVLYQRIYNNTCGAPGLYFQCTDKTCISITKFRDCYMNCQDGSDESENLNVLIFSEKS